MYIVIICLTSLFHFHYWYILIYDDNDIKTSKSNFQQQLGYNEIALTSCAIKCF